MTRRRRDTATGELFGAIPAPAPEVPESMDYRGHVTDLIGQMLADARRLHGRDRWDIAARVSRLAGPETSKALLDSYTAPSREECNAPLWKAPVMELACRSRVLAEWHVSVLGGRVLWGKDVLDGEIGRMQRELDDITRALKAARELAGRIG